MKTMKFREFKAKMIMDGDKTSSLRLYDDKDLRAGDDLELIVWETGKVFAKAKITEIIEKPLGEIGEDDLAGHEKYESKEAMIENQQKYYENVGPETPAKIVRFRLLA